MAIADRLNDTFATRCRVVARCRWPANYGRAGMGVDSGLPDFRGADAFWRAYPALHVEGVHFEDIANPAAFRDDPMRACGSYGHRLDLYRHAAPHRGFDIQCRWGERTERSASVYTSNVDDQVQQHRACRERCDRAVKRGACMKGPARTCRLGASFQLRDLLFPDRPS